MSFATEFTIQMQDRPGALGEVCRALADRDVNIIGFQSRPESAGKSLVHMVTDNRTATKAVLENGRVNFTETEVAQVKLPNVVGALAQDVHLVPVHRFHERVTRGEVAVQGADTDARTPSDVLERDVGAAGGERLGGCGDQQIAIAHRVGTRAAISGHRIGGLHRPALSHRDFTSHTRPPEPQVAKRRQPPYNPEEASVS